MRALASKISKNFPGVTPQIPSAGGATPSRTHPSMATRYMRGRKLPRCWDLGLGNRSHKSKFTTTLLDVSRHNGKPNENGCSSKKKTGSSRESSYLSGELELVHQLMKMFQTAEYVDQLPNSLSELGPSQHRMNVELFPPRRKSSNGCIQQTCARWQALSHYTFFYTHHHIYI